SAALNFFLPSKSSEHISPKELKEVLQSCKNYGLVSQEEGQLIYGYLSLSDCSVKERMQPRHEILFYDINSSISELYNLFKVKQCSRVPVCNGDIQNILGICSAKSLLMNKTSVIQVTDLIAILHKPYYMPETISAKSALCHLIAEKETMGMVIDEYGSIEGLITQEDLFEIVVGEIIDKRDDRMLYTVSNQEVIIAAGKMELSELQQIFNVELPTKNNVVTIGGWLTEQFGTIPETGTKFEWNNLLFQILDAAPNKIRRIYIRKFDA
ncbi:MAG: hemolysin family protein, partial [Victivallaceae bacterium]